MQNFNIVGISIRTTNQDGKSFKDIENLWARFYNENISNIVNNKINDDIYAVYTDYESDYMGEYTLIIGFAVTTLENIPNGCIGREINIGENQKFISKGKMPEAILKTWQDIWQDTNLKRAYRADVTIHGEKYKMGGNDAETETYISIKQ